jgi:hypothetical protein
MSDKQDSFRTRVKGKLTVFLFHTKQVGKMVISKLLRILSSLLVDNLFVFFIGVGLVLKKD